MITTYDEMVRLVSLVSASVLFLVLLLLSRPPRQASRLMRLFVAGVGIFMLAYGLGGTSGVSASIAIMVTFVSVIAAALVAS